MSGIGGAGFGLIGTCGKYPTESTYCQGIVALAWAEVRGEAEAATAGLEPKASGMAAVAETAASPGRVPLATPDATRVHTPTHGDAA